MGFQSWLHICNVVLPSCALTAAGTSRSAHPLRPKGHKCLRADSNSKGVRGCSTPYVKGWWGSLHSRACREWGLPPIQSADPIPCRRVRSVSPTIPARCVRYAAAPPFRCSISQFHCINICDVVLPALVYPFRAHSKVGQSAARPALMVRMSPKRVARIFGGTWAGDSNYYSLPVPPSSLPNM